MVTFGGKEITLLGTPVKVGEMAPEFTAIKRDLSEYNSKEDLGKILIISVVPSIDTGVCSLQTKRFNEEAVKLGDNVKILTISVDLPFAQSRYCSIEGIDNADIVSDYLKKDFGIKYGFLIEEFQLLSRGIVVLNGEGRVEYVEYVSEVRNEVDLDKVLDIVGKIKK
ncbi:MAG: thiol peroxidase [Tissierellia bacterium]|nr:thiol peroxidase [Tissierellia bacterium]